MNPLNYLRIPDTQSFLAITLVVSLVVLVFLLALNGQSDSDTFKILVGGLMTVGFSNIIGFYFGSSQGSKTKDDTINTLSANEAKKS